jgi:hypothetical protein
MTRVGLEPTTYELKERMLIGVLSSWSIAKLCSGGRFANGHRLTRRAQSRGASSSYGFFQGSAAGQ